jgi:hypothetical protein
MSLSVACWLNEPTRSAADFTVPRSTLLSFPFGLGIGAAAEETRKKNG